MDMDSLLGFLPDLIDGGVFYLSAFGVALVIFVVVEVIKRTLYKPEWKEAYWYSGSLIGIGMLLGIVAAMAALYGNRIPIDGPTAVITAMTGMLYGALASGGYEYLKAGREFIGGLAQQFRPSTNVGGDYVGGDKTTVGSMNEVESASIGDNATARIDK